MLDIEGVDDWNAEGRVTVLQDLPKLLEHLDQFPFGEVLDVKGHLMAKRKLLASNFAVELGSNSVGRSIKGGATHFSSVTVLEGSESNH